MDNSEAAEEDPARGRRGEGSGLSFPPVVEGIERGARGAISINAGCCPAAADLRRDSRR